MIMNQLIFVFGLLAVLSANLIGRTLQEEIEPTSKQNEQTAEEQLVEVVDETLERKLSELEANPDVMESHYGQLRAIDSKNAKANEKIRLRMFEINANEAERILLSQEGLVLLPEVAEELIKKLDRESYSLVLGSVEKLRELTWMLPTKCYIDSAEYLFGKSVQFSEGNYALALYVQNKAANMYKSCRESSEFDAIDSIADRLLYDTNLMMKEFVKKVPDNLDEPGSYGYTVAPQFARVVDSIRRVRRDWDLVRTHEPLENLYKKYGKPLSDACEETIDTFDSYKRALRILGVNLSDSPAGQKWMKILNACHYVPVGYLDNDYVNKRYKLPSIENLDLAFELANLMHFGDMRKRPEKIEQSERFGELVEKSTDHLIELATKKGIDLQTNAAFRNGYFASIGRLCRLGYGMRYELIWLSEAGYPVHDENKLNKIRAVEYFCPIVIEGGTYKWQKQVEGVIVKPPPPKPSLFKRIGKGLGQCIGCNKEATLN